MYIAMYFSSTFLFLTAHNLAVVSVCGIQVMVIKNMSTD